MYIIFMQNELVMQLLVFGVFVIQLFNDYHYQIESESIYNKL